MFGLPRCPRHQLAASCAWLGGCRTPRVFKYTSQPLWLTASFRSLTRAILGPTSLPPRQDPREEAAPPQEHRRAQGAPRVSPARGAEKRAPHTRRLGQEGGLGSRKRGEGGLPKGPERGGPGWEGRRGGGPGCACSSHRSKAAGGGTRDRAW